ncbi:MAG: hypothetical protein MSC30_16795 [Gaiellaceae bacterium MAG52_C11]|nr:hypothetical protein [Candidatus Gaiellasilicea maunaloa]
MDERDDRYGFPEAKGASSPSHEPSRSVLAAAGAALVAAIVGGVLWGLIVKLSDYEIGIVAWAIGFLTGSAVVFATGGAKGQRLQALAVVAALLGILVGKYLSFAFAIQEEAESFGASIGLASGEMRTLFRENLDEVFGLFDLLWMAFAVYTAWKIPRLEPLEPTVGPPAP